MPDRKVAVTLSIREDNPDIWVGTLHEPGEENAKILGDWIAAVRREAQVTHVPEHVTNGRKKLPDTRQSITHKFTIHDFEGYLTIGLYEDGTPGEVWLKGNKQGTTVSGLLDAIAIMMSISLQYGIPLESIATKFIGMRFEPWGRTQNNDIPTALSITDYVLRFMVRMFSKEDAKPIEVEAGVYCPEPGCGAELIYTEGCMKCYVCGYSKC